MKLWPLLLGAGILVGGVVLMSRGSGSDAPKPAPAPTGDVRLYLYTALRMTGPELVVSFAGEDGQPMPWVSTLRAIDRLDGQQGARIRLLARRVIVDPASVDRFATQLSMFGHAVEVDFETPVPEAMPKGEDDV